MYSIAQSLFERHQRPTVDLSSAYLYQHQLLKLVTQHKGARYSAHSVGSHIKSKKKKKDSYGDLGV